MVVPKVSVVMLRLGHTLEDRVVLIERLVIEACLTRVNTHIDRLLQPSVLHLIDFPLTDHAVVGASFLVTYCQDGTTHAPVAHVSLQDASLPCAGLALTESTAAPDITIVAGITDTHGLGCHLKATEDGHLSGETLPHIRHLPYCCAAARWSSSSFLASRISFGPKVSSHDSMNRAVR